MAEQYKRHTAYKVWLAGVHSAGKKLNEQGVSEFWFEALSLARVNVIGSVIDVFSSEGYGSLLLDDGTGTIRLKVWGDDLYLVDGKQVGDLVLVVGRVGEFNNERYIRPELIRGVHIDWALLRHVELKQSFGVPSRDAKVLVEVPDTPQVEVEPSLVAREKVLLSIEKHEEASQDVIVSESGMDSAKILVAVHELLKEGEIFSPKKGYYRLV